MAGLKIKYVTDCHDKEFTLNKKYDFRITHDGIEIIDDLGEEHIIATKDNEYGAYEYDEFFRLRFEFVDTE
ncbi:hypothetical protein P8891_12090 [Bacillus atrophaeus]|uniref:hypothetical protein n=1 Tax=Bacillus atrophaeus TaxID=1452 RepID=UPI002282598F|nr:hypothetical protein [Bacillus atrophaeus]MCY7948338.1 hypothetical protein [Bacillus atrophaeus]MCY8097981.1 hypothetical protein [Bacillus atrophaeus]MCY8466997.1 hypothetical protein [Bacillus atrophaeus]MCY8475662.1 hypothetical protein [Bacillus atrophaeus]MCY9167864.1 hypothetical protein [Bacillus atrophaeus]